MNIDKLITLIKTKKYLLLLGFLSILILASVVRYEMRNYQYPVWDEQHYMRMATEFYRIIKYSQPTDMLMVVPFRQPGYPFLILPFLFLFGLSESYFWAQMTNALLYISTIFGIYFLARNFMSNLSSFLASFIFAFYGWTMLHLHLSYSETAVSAFTVWTIFFLLKSDFFQNKKYSFLFGLFLGLGLLVKWIIVVYIFGPLLYVLYKIIKKKLFRKRRIVILAAASFIIAFIISFYPYLHNHYFIFHYFYGHRVGGPMWSIVPPDERNPFSAYSLTYYLNSFGQLGVFFLILILAGFILAFKKKTKLKPILLVVITAYLFSSYALLKADRHIIPIYPYLAILSASIFDYVKNFKYKTLLIALTLLLSVGTYFGSFWGKGPMKESFVSVPLNFRVGQLDKIYFTSVSHPPYIYKISGKEILDFIEKDSRENGIGKPQILSLFYYRSLDEPLMVYNLYTKEKPFAINNYVGSVIVDPDKQSTAFIKSVLNKADYVLLKSGRKIDNFFPEKDIKTLKTLIEVFEKDLNIDAYYEKVHDIWINQDSSVVTIYKKKKDVEEEKILEMGIRFSGILKNTK